MSILISSDEGFVFLWMRITWLVTPWHGYSFIARSLEGIEGLFVCRIECVKLRLAGQFHIFRDAGELLCVGIKTSIEGIKFRIRRLVWVLTLDHFRHFRPACHAEFLDIPFLYNLVIHMKHSLSNGVLMALAGRHFSSLLMS